MFEKTLERLGLEEINSGACAGGEWLKARGPELESLNPATGLPLARVVCASADDYHLVAARAEDAFRKHRSTPPPALGEMIRRFGDALRARKRDLGMLVTLETGKILAEGEGEVQEMIDMCDFAVGLSRQLYGLTIASERPHHRLMELWRPLGPVGVITAFNFPVAVWAWNAALAAICGDTVLWKPSPETPLTAIAVQRLANEAAESCGLAGVFSLCVGGADDVGRAMTHDRRLPLISATGSCAMGRRVGEAVSRRLGRVLLELGGNNAIVVAPSATLDLAVRAVVFAAVGTAGQRCTTVRRLIMHESVAETMKDRLTRIYRTIAIGDPWTESVLMGPLINERAVQNYLSALERARSEGGEILYGGRRLDRDGFFVDPTLVLAKPTMKITREETFAPILYLMTYRHLDEALEIHNSVDQGLSSAIFTNDLSEAERFISAEGSDCGIANVNIGTSGAEIGGAFGGEKDSGGGREAGSDAWKAYMRRQTCTINHGRTLPLAQGITFDVAP